MKPNKYTFDQILKELENDKPFSDQEQIRGKTFDGREIMYIIKENYKWEFLLTHPEDVIEKNKGYIVYDRIYFNSKKTEKQDLHFKNLIMKDDFTIDHSTFGAKIVFEDSYFLKPAKIEDTEFKGNVIFKNCIFIDTFSTCKQIFPGKVSFEQTTFYNNAVFQHVQFIQGTSFRSCTIMNTLSCKNCVFSGRADFSFLSGDGSLELTRSQFLKELDHRPGLSFSEFNGEIMIDSLLEEQFSKVDLNNAARISDLEGCIFNQGSLFPIKKFNFYSFKKTIFACNPFSDAQFINCDFTGAIFVYKDMNNWTLDDKTILNTKYVCKNYKKVCIPQKKISTYFDMYILFKIKDDADKEFMKSCYYEISGGTYHKVLKLSLSFKDLDKIDTIIKKIGYKSDTEQWYIIEKESRIQLSINSIDTESSTYLIIDHINAKRSNRKSALPQHKRYDFTEIMTELDKQCPFRKINEIQGKTRSGNDINYIILRDPTIIEQYFLADNPGFEKGKAYILLVDIKLDRYQKQNAVSKKTDCSHWIFQRGVDLRGTSFHEDVDCSHAQFLWFVHCNATFFKSVDFSNAWFKKDVDFTGVRFWDKVKFDNIQFPAGTMFWNAFFAEKLVLNLNQFQGTLDFSNTEFKEDVIMQGNSIKLQCIFSRTKFAKNCTIKIKKNKYSFSLKECKIDGSLRIENSVFSGEFDLSKAQMRGEVLLINCMFYKNPGFSYTEFYNSITIQNTHLITYPVKDKDRPAARSLVNIDFSHAVFYDNFEFRGIDTIENTSFKNASIFAPLFPSIQFNNCDFTGAVIKLVNKKKFKIDAKTAANTRYIYTDYTVVYNPDSFEMGEFDPKVLSKLHDEEEKQFVDSSPFLKRQSELNFVEHCYPGNSSDYTFRLRRDLNKQAKIQLWNILKKTGIKSEEDKEYIIFEKSRIPQEGEFGIGKNKDFTLLEYLEKS